jgi:hypothetical protein
MKVPKHLTERIEKSSVEEIFGDAPTSIIRLLKDKSINYSLSKKRGLNEKPTTRVLTHWVKEGIVHIEKKDRGKIKRFDKIEGTWLNLVVEMRNFGISIEHIKKPREYYFDYKIENSSLFKLKLLWSILISPQLITMDDEGNMSIYSIKHHNTYFKPNVYIPSHVCVSFNNFIEQEYPNASFYQNYGLSNPTDSVEKLKLLYFLKTGDFQSMKVKLFDSDIRFFNSSKLLLENKEIMTYLSEWNFKEITIQIDEEMESKIKPK